MPTVLRARLTWLALLLVSLALLAACGPGEPAQPSSADNTATTAAIARTYAADNNLQQASAALADLSVANLSGANLSGAHLFGADLSFADLRGAIFENADLTNVRGIETAHGLETANFKGTIYEGKFPPRSPDKE